jgi:hypothetical protein
LFPIVLIVNLSVISSKEDVAFAKAPPLSKKLQEPEALLIIPPSA